MNQGSNPFNHTSKHYKNRKLDIENRMSKRAMFYQLSEALRGGEDIHSSGKERNDIILTFSFIKISANKWKLLKKYIASASEISFSVYILMDLAQLYMGPTPQQKAARERG